MYVLFEVYLEQLTVEELLISEVGERRAARRVEPSQYHPCLAFVSFRGTTLQLQYCRY